MAVDDRFVPDKPKASEPASVAAQVEPAGMPGASGLGIVVAVVLVAALYYGREVLIPITIAVLLSFLLTALVELLRRVWLGRVPSVVLAVILGLGTIVALSTAIGTQMAHLAKNAPQYQTTIEAKFTSLRDSARKSSPALWEG